MHYTGPRRRRRLPKRAETRPQVGDVMLGMRACRCPEAAAEWLAENKRASSLSAALHATRRARLPAARVACTRSI